MLAQLRAGRVEPFNETEVEGVDRFAHIADLEGNTFELWEPSG